MQREDNECRYSTHLTRSNFNPILLPPSFPAKQHTRHCSSSPNRKARLFVLKESKQFDGGIRIGHGTGERVVVSEHLEVLAVARGAAVGGHHAVERAVPAPEPRQPDPDHHGFVFLEFLAGAGAAFFPPPAALRSSRVQGRG